jgi:hypothetical protein
MADPPSMVTDTQLTAVALIRATINEDVEAIPLLASNPDVLLVTHLAAITAGLLEEGYGSSEKATEILDGWVRQIVTGVAP